MRRIREVIIVEGRHDTARLRQYFDCTTIETGGTALNEETKKQILQAARDTGIIIFTDPDGPGNRIRHAVSELVPDARHAFVNRKEARTEKKVGVEHAEEAALWTALENLVSFAEEPGTLTAVDLYELGLSGGHDSALRRQQIGELYHIGYANTKTFLERLNHKGITKEELERKLHGE